MRNSRDILAILLVLALLAAVGAVGYSAFQFAIARFASLNPQAATVMLAVLVTLLVS